MSVPAPEAPWLLLVHQLPAEPSRVRVKAWRRLQGIGAVALKNSVYVLPNIPECREDFEWVRAEILEEGGEAIVFTAHTVDDRSSAEIRESLSKAREADWKELTGRCSEVLASYDLTSLDDEDLYRLRRQVRSLRSRAQQLDRVDPSRGPARREAFSALDTIEVLIAPRHSRRMAPEAPRSAEQYRGRRWITRPHPGVDRMASAWLIRRFIDPEPQFLFGEKPLKEPGVVPFDMFGVEFGHRGNRVTFETLVDEFGVDDPAVARIARIVNELDLRASDISDPETATVEQLVAGLRASFGDDATILDHGMAFFEALYTSFSGQAGAVS